MSAFASFVRSLAPGAPVVCFGPRRVPSSVLEAAFVCGRFVAGSGRPVWSGGARGCDSAFVSGAESVGGSVRVFRPLPGSGVPGLFARSELCLRSALAVSGGAVVLLPEGVLRSGCGLGRGSLWSARCAVRLGLPLLVVRFSSSGAFRVVPEKFNIQEVE